LFVDFAKCVELNFHGFRQLHNIKIETDRVNRKLLRSYYRNLPDATESVTDIRFDLELDLPSRGNPDTPGALENRSSSPFTSAMLLARQPFPAANLGGKANPHARRPRSSTNGFPGQRGSCWSFLP
jgi:hypothetical protein